MNQDNAFTYLIIITCFIVVGEYLGKHPELMSMLFWGAIGYFLYQCYKSYKANKNNG